MVSLDWFSSLPAFEYNEDVTHSLNPTLTLSRYPTLTLSR